jgi:hypothetical protein
MRDEQIPEIKALLKTSPTAAIRLSPSSEVEESRFFDIHGKGLHYPSDIQNDLAQAGILQTEAQPDKLPDSKFFVKYVGSKATTHTYEDLSNDQNMSASNSENNSASKTQLTKVDIVTAGANKVKELVLKADQADPIPETKKHDIAKKPASGSKNAKSQASHPKVSPSPKSNQPKPDNQDTKPIKDLVPKSLTAEVAVARHEYATITAELRRKFIVSKKNKELEKKARERINNSHTVMKSSLIDIMKSKDLEPAEQLDILEQEDHLAAEKIAISIKSQSEKLAEPSVRLSNRKQKFNNRWASRGGGEKFDRHRMVGTSKKVGRIALGGLLIGAAAGLAVGGDTGIVIGPVIGSIAAVGTSRKVAQGLAGGHVDKNKNSKTVAQAQSEAHLAATNDSISKIYDQYRSDQIEDVDDISDPSITHYYSKETDKIVSRNRRRLFRCYSYWTSQRRYRGHWW